MQLRLKVLQAVGIIVCKRYVNVLGEKIWKQLEAYKPESGKEQFEITILLIETNIETLVCGIS